MLKKLIAHIKEQDYKVTKSDGKIVLEGVDLELLMFLKYGLDEVEKVIDEVEQPVEVDVSWDYPTYVPYNVYWDNAFGCGASQDTTTLFYNTDTTSSTVSAPYFYHSRNDSGSFIP